MDEMITEAAIKTCLIYRIRRKLAAWNKEKKTKNLDVDRWLLRMYFAVFPSKLHSTSLSACVQFFFFFPVYSCIVFSHFFVFAHARSALSIFILFNDYFFMLQRNRIFLASQACRCQYFIYFNQIQSIFLKTVLFKSLIASLGSLASPF